METCNSFLCVGTPSPHPPELSIPAPELHLLGMTSTLRKTRDLGQGRPRSPNPLPPP